MVVGLYGDFDSNHIKEEFMKKYFVAIIVFIFILAGSAAGKQITIEFGWDANTESDMAGYALFMKKGADSSYDYNDPRDPLCTIAEDGKCYTDVVNKVCGFALPFEATDGELATYYFVARARDADGNWSGDSNEVSKEVDLRVLPSALVTTFTYNDVTKTIDFAFTQDQVDRVVRWELYKGDTSGGPYTKAGELANSGQGSPYSMSWEVPGDGDYYFVIVGFAELVNSADSGEVYINVKVHPGKPHNFKIKAYY